MKQRQVELDNLPKPGEPLRPHIHEDNQRLLDEEIAERARRVQAKLKFWERVRLRLRYNRLWKLLNQARYNPMVKERYNLLKTCTRLKYEAESADEEKRPAMLADMRQAARRGKKLGRRIQKYQAQADEFADIGQRLRAHDEVIAWEREDTENKAAFRREALVWREQLKAVMYQTPRMHHAGTDERGNRFIRIPFIERMLVKDDRVLYQVRTTAQSILERFFGNRWHSDLPYGVDINDLVCTETLENLSAGCNRTVTAERSKSGKNLFYSISRMDAPDGIPNRMLYQKTIDWYPIEDQAKTPWAAGVTNDRKVFWYNFEDQPHVLIAGSTQSGKSNHVNTMIATCVTMNSPQEVRVMLIDLKGGVEFTHWQGIKHALCPMIKSPETVLEGLQSLRFIMEQRLAIFEAIKAKNLASYNHKSDVRLPRIICFVDELATLIGLGELTTNIHKELRVISSQGRAAGVHLVLCTQHPSSDTVPGWIKTNMTLRIASKMPSHTASIIVLDSVSAATLPSIAGRMVFSIGRQEMIAQSPFISDNEIERSVKISQTLFSDPDNSEFSRAAPVTVVEKFSKLTAIGMAVEQFDGHLSAKRIHEVVGNDVITRRKLEEMVQAIVDEEEVERGGVWYRIFKRGKGFYLEAMPRYHTDEDDEDTGEFRGIERGIEDEPIEEAAI